MMSSNPAIFAAKCPHCGHVTYFNKNKVCRDSVEVWRGDSAKLETLLLTCSKCKEDFEFDEDCGAYRD